MRKKHALCAKLVLCFFMTQRSELNLHKLRGKFFLLVKPVWLFVFFNRITFTAPVKKEDLI